MPNPKLLALLLTRVTLLLLLLALPLTRVTLLLLPSLWPPLLTRLTLLLLAKAHLLQRSTSLRAQLSTLWSPLLLLLLLLLLPPSTVTRSTQKESLLTSTPTMQPRQTVPRLLPMRMLTLLPPPLLQ